MQLKSQNIVPKSSRGRLNRPPVNPGNVRESNNRASSWPGFFALFAAAAAANMKTKCCRETEENVAQKQRWGGGGGEKV